MPECLGVGGGRIGKMEKGEGKPEVRCKETEAPAS